MRARPARRLCAALYDSAPHPVNADTSFAAPLVGRQLTAAEKRDHSWLFTFGSDLSLATEGPWRLVVDGRVVGSSEDHGQVFGLSEALDASSQLHTHLHDQNVEATSVVAGDLILRFPADTSLQLLQLSSGFESWRFSFRGHETICCGAESFIIYHEQFVV